MKFLSEWSEVVGSCAWEQQQYDLWVTAVAYHDDMSNELVVYRDSYLREKTTYGPDEYAYPEWLPEPDVVHRMCGHDRAAEIAERTFADWIRLLQERNESATQPECAAAANCEDMIFEREMLDGLATA